MDVLLAIKPEFAEKILDGEKGYEFRRTAFRDATETDLIFLYASSPTSKIVGVFTTTRTIEASPTDLWDLFGAESGTDDKNRLLDYFDGVETGYAIQTDRTYRFDDPIPPADEIPDFSPPMSFEYLDSNASDALRAYVPESFQSRTEATHLTQFGETDRSG